jgi:hypothetical protein
MKTKTKTKTLTLDEVKKRAHPTWFEFSLDGETITFESRRHGDVCEGTHGREDMVEARRIRALLPPATHHKRTLEAVDEWTVATIATNPYPAAVIRENVRKVKFLKKFVALDAEVKSIPSMHNCGSPFRLTHDDEKAHWILSVGYGVTCNPRHLQHQFATPQEAEKAGAPIAGKWGAYEVTVNPHPDLTTFFTQEVTHKNLGTVTFKGTFA